MSSEDKDNVQNRAVTRALSSVGATVEAFADRMKRKLKEQESIADQSKKASDARHALILQALTTIRKALQETAKIDLGDRFHFELDVSDWEGWPRLDLNLIDGIAPEIVSYALTVTAHDRNETGLIQMNMKSGESVGHVALKNKEEFEKLPIVLKRAIRRFLDSVTPHILNPASPKAAAPKNTEITAQLTQDTSTTKALAKENFFVEEDDREKNKVHIEEDAPKPIDGL